jgi:hypothetical protein
MHFGPESLRATRIDYNRAIQQTNDQELLLNLVRLRYRDTLYFLNVERVASSLEITSTMAATAEFPSGAANTFTLGEASYSFMENPTVFYLPLEGEKFVRQMMTPFNLNLLVLLTSSGWSVERVLTVMVREMNGVKNAPSASGPTPSDELRNSPHFPGGNAVAAQPCRSATASTSAASLTTSRPSNCALLGASPAARKHVAYASCSV